MGEEKGIWGAVAWQAEQAGVPLPLTRAAQCVTERMQPWSIAVQRNMELWIAGNCWNVVLIWKISFIRLGRTRITKPRGYATISRWEQIEPVKHMIGPSANRKCCSPNPQFDFYTRYALFCPKHMSVHAWALISTPVLCEQLWSHLLTMKGFELSRCRYSFAFSLPVTRTTARMNTFLDHFVWELNTAALMLLLCYAVYLCLCDCWLPLSRRHNPELTMLCWIHHIFLSWISKTQTLTRAECFFPRYHIGWCVPSFLLFFAYFMLHVLCAFVSLLCYQCPDSQTSSPDQQMIQVQKGYCLHSVEEKLFQGLD